MEITHLGMGTIMAHTAHGSSASLGLQAVQTEAGRLERLLSRYQVDSDITRINLNAGVRRTTISPETNAVLTQAIRLSTLTCGAFDATIGPLVDLWDYRHACVPPSPESIRQAVRYVDHKDITLFKDTGEAMLCREGQSLDLGGIGKGYASDVFLRILRAYGISSAYTNLGGNVATLGSRPDGSPWRVGVRHPRSRGSICSLAVTNLAVVTSGDYERYFIDPSGKRYHHIIDPQTGYPAKSGLISVTAISPDAMVADGFSTALFVAGLDRGIALLKQVESMQAVFIDESLTLYYTSGLGDRLQTAAGVKSVMI